MTIAIHRQSRLQRLLVVLGLVGMLAIVVVATLELTGTDGAVTLAPVGHRVPGGNHSQRLDSIQDGDLAPATPAVGQAVATAWIDLQDGYLPPSGSPAAETEAIVAAQDGFLPPPVATDAIRLGAIGPQ